MSDVSDGCTLVLGPLGQVWRAGGETETLVGAEPRALAGVHIAELLSGHDRRRLFEEMRDAFLTGGCGRLRCELVGDHGAVSVELLLEPQRSDGAIHQWIVRCMPLPGESGVARGQLDLSASAIERGLRAGEFDLDFQPIIRLATHETIGYEALVRWVHPRRGRVPARDFLPAIEAAGLMAALSRVVVERGLQQLAGWADSDPTCGMTLNVAARDLVRPDFASDVARAVSDAGVDPGRLVLEFATGTLDADLDDVGRALARLRSVAAVQLAVDGYGGTRSSLATLTLPVDVVKLDPRLTSWAARSTAHRSVLGSLMELTRTFGTLVIGAGIEEGSQMEVLEAVGCEYAQGYLLGRPSPAEQR